MKQKAKPKAPRRAAAKKPVKKTARRKAVSAKVKPKSRSLKATAKAVAKPKAKPKVRAKVRAKAAPVKKAQVKKAQAKRTVLKKALAKRPAKARGSKHQARPAKSLNPPQTQSLADLLDPGNDPEFESAAFEATPAPETLAPGDAARAGARRGAADEAQSESGETPARANKLVPTNAVHTTKRRAKRNTWQTPVLGLTAVAAVLAILVLGHESAPPDVSPLERRADARQGEHTPNILDPLQAAPERALETPAVAARPAVPQWGDQPGQQAETWTREPEGLKVLDLVELERMLARLEMGPSRPDGIVDQQTTSAIRMYQQIAGLPVDGEPTVELLDDMREVVKMLDGVN